MTRFCHRLLPLLRVLVLGLLALGFVLQPVMATTGEMHELAHGFSGVHGHALHADDADTAVAAAGEQDQDGARTLHVLLHFAHCCGAGTALRPLLQPIPAMPVHSRVAVAKTPIPLQARLATPFKPPIFI